MSALMNQYELREGEASATAAFVLQLPLQTSAQWVVFLVNNELALYGVSHYFSCFPCFSCAAFYPIEILWYS
jgi:hypothetical protein